MEEKVKKQSFAPYVDETVEPPESYLVFCENYSPWDEDEKNMIRVHSNKESHKMLEILEHHFGIKNNLEKANISKICNNYKTKKYKTKYQTCGGFKWKFKD